MICKNVRFGIQIAFAVLILTPVASHLDLESRALLKLNILEVIEFNVKLQVSGGHVAVWLESKDD